jgi:hypothetical protein
VIEDRMSEEEWAKNRFDEKDELERAPWSNSVYERAPDEPWAELEESKNAGEVKEEEKETHKEDGWMEEWTIIELVE